MFRLRAVLHATPRLRCFHLSFRFSMLLPLVFWLSALICARLGPLRGRLRLGGLASDGLGSGLRGMSQLCEYWLDRLIGRQLCVGVELEVASPPDEAAQDCLVAPP